VERTRVEIARGRLLDEVLDILADPLVSDADAGRLVRARVGMPRLQAARRPMAERDPRDHGHFDLLAARYKYLRTFTPAVIGHLPLTGNTANPDVDALLAAVEVLRELNAAARTSVPEQATTQEATAFVPARWRGYLDQAHGHGRGAAYRHRTGMRHAIHDDQRRTRAAVRPAVHRPQADLLAGRTRVGCARGS